MVNVKHLPDPATLAIAICLPVIAGFIGGIVSATQVKTWYAKLKKPTWTPPNWLFGPAWTVLYICMGVASWFVYKQGGFSTQSIPLAWYAVNLVLNFSWTPLFFGMHRPDLALLDIIAMLAVETVMLLEFAQVIGWQLAGPLLIPYLMWTMYATALTFYIWRHNPMSGSLGASLLMGHDEM